MIITKFRADYVTNSSSSSYIICFARIEDEEKAKHVIDKYNLKLNSASDIKDEMWHGELGSDWAGAICYNAPNIINKYPDDKFILIEEYIDADYDDEEDDFEPIYYYDFDCNDAIEEITKENGFTDIEVSEGEGRNG